MSDHFTAIVEITKTKPRNENVRDDQRVKQEVVKFIVRDTDLKKLTEKVQKHLELVEDTK